jgi:anti-sigma B factor antagonist
MILDVNQKQVEPDITLLEFRGRIALGRESQRIETLVGELIGKNQKKLVFDLGGVDYIDSAGIGILTFCFGSMKEAGGSLRIANATDRVKKLFHFTHVDTFLTVFPSVEEACRDFDAPPAA